MSWTISKCFFDFAWRKEFEVHANHAKTIHVSRHTEVFVGNAFAAAKQKCFASFFYSNYFLTQKSLMCLCLVDCCYLWVTYHICIRIIQCNTLWMLAEISISTNINTNAINVIWFVFVCVRGRICADNIHLF